MIARLRSIGRLWRTVRFLRPVQIRGRIWFGLARPRPDLSPAPPLRMRIGAWQHPAQRQPSLIASDVFFFLNDTGSLAAHGWDGPDKPKLWRYNQHYFDDLNAAAASSRTDWHRELIADWINANPPGKGTGWEPYPTSLRIANWVKRALAGLETDEAALQSLAIQTRWLTRRMETHLLGNHLFANAKALVFSGLFFDGPEAERWLEKGIQILEREISEQILPDGGQFELSPMYHALALEDMLDLVNVLQTFNRRDIATRWRTRIPSMIRWLSVMSHPDSSLAFFNDSALGIAPDNKQLIGYANRLEIPHQEPLAPMTYLENSGYVRMAAGQFILLADVARIGPDYLPGHAHADTLSFELSYAGQRVLVNSGTSEYGVGQERIRQRGTAAHNTVIVDGQNSSEVWSGFRVGRRARPFAISVEQDERGVLFAQASHDGYRHQPGRPIVSRHFELDGIRFRIIDTITTDAHAESRLHVHPLVTVDLMNNDFVVLTMPDGQKLSVQCETGPIRLEKSTWHPEFGMSIPNICLVSQLTEKCAMFCVQAV